MRARTGATGPFWDLNATFFHQTCRKRVRLADSTERFLGGDSRSGIFSGKQALDPRSTPHTHRPRLKREYDAETQATQGFYAGAETLAQQFYQRRCSDRKGSDRRATPCEATSS